MTHLQISESQLLPLFTHATNGELLLELKCFQQPEFPNERLLYAWPRLNTSLGARKYNLLITFFGFKTLFYMCFTDGIDLFTPTNENTCKNLDKTGKVTPKDSLS